MRHARIVKMLNAEKCKSVEQIMRKNRFANEYVLESLPQLLYKFNESSQFVSTIVQLRMYVYK